MTATALCIPVSSSTQQRVGYFFIILQEYDVSCGIYLIISL